jgi:hypothetical protein
MTNLTRSHFQAYPFHLVSPSPLSMYTYFPLFYGKIPITRSFSNKSTEISLSDKEYISEFSRAFVAYFFTVPFEKYTEIQLFFLEITEEFFLEHINHVDFDDSIMELENYVVYPSAAEIENYYGNINNLLKGLDTDPHFYVSDYKYRMSRIFLTKTKNPVYF